jgi:hypothetical protein
MSAMTTITAPAARPGRFAGASKLRLLSSGERPRTHTVAPETPRRDATNTATAAEPAPTMPLDAPVLVAGRDAARRASMIAEFERTMAPETKFVHASAFWEVLVLAGQSRMVILSGDLDEVPTDSLMRMLGHRYPALPVVALDAAAQA